MSLISQSIIGRAPKRGDELFPTKVSVAKYLGVSVKTVDRYQAAGVLPLIKTGLRRYGQWKSAIDAWLKDIGDEETAA